MKRVRIILSALALGAALAFAAACGGGSDNGNGGQPLSAADYAASLSRLCVESNDKIDALGAFTDVGDLAERGGDLVSIGEEMREQIASLSPPEHFAGKHASLLDVFDSGIETTRDLVEAAKDEDEARAAALLEEFDRLSASEQEIESAVGASDCLA
jgi:hypothetical protein